MEQNQDPLTKAHEFELSYRAHPSVTTDDFYTPPADSANAPPGTLLKVEEITDPSLYTLAPNLSLSRFMYQSKTSGDRLVPVSAYILWPYIAKDYGDGPPVVVWAHGTSGINDESAPSNIQHLWHHFQAPYQLALLGYVVVATDYAGLGVGKDGHGKPIVHEYLNSIGQGNDVAYSIIAARAAFPELSKRFVVLGSSLGGMAAWGYAEKLAKEPIEGHLGTVILHPVTNLLHMNLSESMLGFVMLYMVPAFMVHTPDFKPEHILTEAGQQSLKTLLDLKGCNTAAFNLGLSDVLKPDWRDNPAIKDYVSLTAVGSKKIAGDLLFIHGEEDAAVAGEPVQKAVEKLASENASVNVKYYTLPNVTHAPAMYASLQIYVDWIDARFSGKRLKPGYTKETIKPLRPAAAQQLEANWHIEKQAGPWQAT